jgi:hypothetical protein
VTDIAQQLPDGMVPMTGVFHYEDADYGPHDLAVSHGQFVLFAQFRADDMSDPKPSQVSLTVMVASEVIYLPPHEPGDEPVHFSAALSVEPQYTEAGFLKSRDAAALDGYRLVYRDPDEDWFERPATLYNDFYGGTMLLDVALDFREGGYDLVAEGLDEFQRRFHISARLPVFQVVLRGADGSRDDPRPERWLAEQFDPALLTVRWKHCGSADYGWYDLEANFNEQ